MEGPTTEQEAHAIISAMTHPLWEIPKGFEKIGPGILAEIATKKVEGKYAFSTRARTRAIEALGRLVRNNFSGQPVAPAPPQLHVHTNGSVEDVRRAIQDDAQYLEYLRSCEGDSDPGAIREEGVGGDVETGSPPVGD